MQYRTKHNDSPQRSRTLYPELYVQNSKSRTLERWGESTKVIALCCVELRMFAGLLLPSRCLVQYRAAAALDPKPHEPAGACSIEGCPFRGQRRQRRRVSTLSIHLTDTSPAAMATSIAGAYARLSAASGVQLVLQGGLARPQRRRLYVAREGGVRRHECRRAPRLRRPVQPQAHEGQDASLQHGDEGRKP